MRKTVEAIAEVADRLLDKVKHLVSRSEGLVNEPNAATCAAMVDARQGTGVVHYNSLQDMFDALDNTGK